MPGTSELTTAELRRLIPADLVCEHCLKTIGRDEVVTVTVTNTGNTLSVKLANGHTITFLSLKFVGILCPRHEGVKGIKKTGYRRLLGHEIAWWSPESLKTNDRKSDRDYDPPEYRIGVYQ